MPKSIAATNLTKTGGRSTRGLRSSVGIELTRDKSQLPTPAELAPRRKVRFYFEERDGSLTPIYGAEQFPDWSPIGIVQTNENAHGPAPQHPVFQRKKP